jgi:septal ring factor EnvC (AmiA/AmiB activator)
MRRPRPRRDDRIPRADPLPADVETLHTHLALARAQNADLYRQLQKSIQDQDTPKARTTAALTRENRQLRAQLAQAEAQVQAWQEAYESVSADADQARTTLRDAQTTIGDLRRRCLAVEMQMLKLKLQYERPSPSQGPDIDRALRQLLTLAHPDKWSQGQPAGELAHELTVCINDLRQRGRP